MLRMIGGDRLKRFLMGILIVGICVGFGLWFGMRIGNELSGNSKKEAVKVESFSDEMNDSDSKEYEENTLKEGISKNDNGKNTEIDEENTDEYEDKFAAEKEAEQRAVLDRYRYDSEEMFEMKDVESIDMAVFVEYFERKSGPKYFAEAKVRFPDGDSKELPVEMTFDSLYELMPDGMGSAERESFPKERLMCARVKYENQVPIAIEKILEEDLYEHNYYQYIGEEGDSLKFIYSSKLNPFDIREKDLQYNEDYCFTVKFNPQMSWKDDIKIGDMVEIAYANNTLFGMKRIGFEKEIQDKPLISYSVDSDIEIDCKHMEAGMVTQLNSDKTVVVGNTKGSEFYFKIKDTTKIFGQKQGDLLDSKSQLFDKGRLVEVNEDILKSGDMIYFDKDSEDYLETIVVIDCKMKDTDFRKLNYNETSDSGYWIKYENKWKYFDKNDMDDYMFGIREYHKNIELIELEDIQSGEYLKKACHVMPRLTNMDMDRAKIIDIREMEDGLFIEYDGFRTGVHTCDVFDSELVKHVKENVEVGDEAFIYCDSNHEAFVFEPIKTSNMTSTKVLKVAEVLDYNEEMMMVTLIDENMRKTSPLILDLRNVVIGSVDQNEKNFTKSFDDSEAILEIRLLGKSTIVEANCLLGNTLSDFESFYVLEKTDNKIKIKRDEHYRAKSVPLSKFDENNQAWLEISDDVKSFSDVTEGGGVYLHLDEDGKVDIMF
ncbi:MAG: hypothetical protein N4A40_14605 [Tissierellales bacterium]|nr:hypothetical protein [Tissierellales bacterium]